MTDGRPPDEDRMADEAPSPGGDRPVEVTEDRSGEATVDEAAETATDDPAETSVDDPTDAGEGGPAAVEDDGDSPTPVVRYVGDDPERRSGAAVAVGEAPADGGGVPEDVRKYDRFKKIDGGTYERANEFLRDRTYVTAREWAIARLCADFRTETGVEMTKIGENLPELVPFMTDTYTPQAVNQARSSFEGKVRKSGATFLYGAMCDFFTAEELDDVMYEATEVAKFLLEVEGVELSVDDELEAEDRISSVMREVREHSAALRHDEVSCPECGHEFEAGGE